MHEIKIEDLNKIMSLIDELSAIASQCNPRQMIDDRRAQACDEALKEITCAFSDKAREAQRNGRTQARLIEWSFEENRRYHECYLLDLLSKGDLLRRLQNWCDELHGQGNFKVYYTVPTPRHREMAIYVSWDKVRFEEIDDRLAKLKESRERRLEDGPRETQPRDDQDDLPRMRREFRPRNSNQDGPPRMRPEFRRPLEAPSNNGHVSNNSIVSKNSIVSTDQSQERRDFRPRNSNNGTQNERRENQGRPRVDFRSRPNDRPTNRGSDERVPFRQVSFKKPSEADPLTVLNDKTAGFDFGDQ